MAKQSIGWQPDTPTAAPTDRANGWSREVAGMARSVETGETAKNVTEWAIIYRSDTNEQAFDAKQQGIADPGTTGRGTRERGVPSAANPLEVLLERALAETGIEREDLRRILHLIEGTSWALPPFFVPGAPIWLRLIRYLLDRGEQQRAEQLFARGGKESISWVQDVLDRHWPIGTGVAVDVAVAATFGVPLQLTGKTAFSLVRTSRATVKLMRQGTLNGGFDTGIGAGGFLRLGTQGIGGSAGAQAQAGLQLVAREEFEFPVLEDVGFTPLLVYLADADSLVRIGALFWSALLALTPDVYRVRIKLEAKAVGSGVAAAEAGLRTPGAKSGAGGQRITGSKFGRRQGKQEDSRRESVIFHEKIDKTLNWRAVVQAILRASTRADILIDVGGGVEVRPTYQPHPIGVRSLQSLELQLYGEGQTVSTIVSHVPVVGALIPGLGMDVGGGIRLTWRVLAPFSKKSIHFMGHELYLNSGDLESFQGPAHEIALQLPGLDPAAYVSLSSFLAAVQASTMEHRFAVGSPLGRNYVIALGKSEQFTVMLSPKYQEWGMHVLGFVTVKFRLPGEVLSRILGMIGTVLVESLERDPKVQQLVRNVTQGLEEETVPENLTETVQEAAISVLTEAVRTLQTFLETGKLSPKLTRLVDDILKELLAGLQKVELRAELGLGIGAGGRLAKGATFRLTGTASGRVVYEREVTQELSGLLKDNLMEADDLLALLKGAWDETPTLLSVTPEELRY